MRLTPAILVIADISGYTGFIRRREVSLLHAEQIVSDLIEALVSGAERPLILNKLEGDAALLYVESGPEPRRTAAAVVASLRAGFEAFRARLQSIRSERSHCNCAACANIGGLSLKAFVHSGEIAIKQLRQFEELAGEEVILIHRLLKNQVASSEYVLMTEDFVALLDAPPMHATVHVESVEGLGEVPVRVLLVDAESLSRLSAPTGLIPARAGTH